jgi:hypothetical protein
MLLRPGNAGSNTFADNKEVPAAALRQVRPGSGRRSSSASTGPAPATISSDRPLSLSSPRRTALFTCGWMITAADEDATGKVPAGA